jgi:hypothetical protein
MEAEVSYAANVHVAVYQVLDRVLGAQAAPPGAKAVIHSIIDDLRFASAPSDLIERTEAISLQLHQLESALGRRDSEAASAAKQQLRSIAASWLDHRIAN